MTPTQHEAWEQMLSVAKGAALEVGPELAAYYLASGGYRHVVARIEPTWLPAEPPPAPAVTVETTPSATSHTPDGHGAL
jgi:hypothetical protein